MGWFSKVERLYWEQWCIQLHVLRAGPHEVKKQVYDGAPSGNNGGGFQSGTLALALTFINVFPVFFLHLQLSHCEARARVSWFLYLLV